MAPAAPIAILDKSIDAPPPSAAERLALKLAAGALLAALAAAAWATPYLPTNDGVHHLYAAFARAHLDEASRGYGEFLLGNAPPTANLVGELFVMLEPWLGWQDATRALLTLLVLAWAAASLWLAGALHPARRAAGLLVAACAWGFNTWHGQWHFLAATAIACCALALSLRARQGAFRRVAVAGLLLLGAWVHVLAAALAGVAILVARVALVERERHKEVALLALAGLPAMAILLATMRAASGALSDPAETLPLALRVASWGAATIGGPWWRQAPLLLGLGAAALLLALGWRRRTRLERALGALAASFFAVPLVLPWTVLGWQHAAARPLLLGAVLWVALLPIERLRPALRWIVLGLCASSALAATAWSWRLHSRIANDVTDIVTAADQAAPHGYRWPFVLVQPDWVADAHIFRWDPLRSIGSLFGLTQGGLVAHSFMVVPSNHSALIKDSVLRQRAPPLMRSRYVTPIRRIFDDEQRASRIEALASHAVQVDGVIVLERPRDHAVWMARGYQVDLERGRVLLARFVGCSLLVEGSGARSVRTALSPAPPDALNRTDDIDGDATLERLPCGALSVSAFDAVGALPCQEQLVTLSPGVLTRTRCSR